MEPVTEDTSMLEQIEEVRGKGMGLVLRAILAESMTAVERNKSHQFTSRVITQRSLHASRCC